MEKTIEPLENEDIELGDRTNVAFMSSSVTKGKGKGIAVYTGQRTEIGMIADSVSKSKKDGTNLEVLSLNLFFSVVMNPYIYLFCNVFRNE